MKEVTLAREYSTANAGNAVRGDVRTVGGVTENGYSAPLKRSILSYEHKQRQEWNEAMAYYDANGNQLARTQSKKHDEVPFKEKDIPKDASGNFRDDIIFTHNHPDALGKTSYGSIGNSLSTEDMVGAVKYNAKEMRAVTPHYTFSFKRPSGGWNATTRQVRAAYRKAMKKVREDGEYYYGKAGMTDVANERYMTTYWHKVNKIVAKEFGWNYSKKKG